ncbi:MAG: nitrous oxide reductase accessory protein NosL [Thiotrichales bacterium]
MNIRSISRRTVLRMLATGGTLGALTWRPVNAESPTAARCDTDGTPLQFVPKVAPDADPLNGELDKYPKCPYCGMDRKQWHHSRHLVVYEDNLVDGTCSLHCLALSLALNIDRGPKTIFAADFGASDQLRPLIEVETARYLIGSKLKGTMTAVSKMAFSSEAAAAKAQAEHGGEIGDFDKALRAAYSSLADDTLRIRKMRAERRARMKQPS